MNKYVYIYMQLYICAMMLCMQQCVCICARMHMVSETRGCVLFASSRQDAIDQVQSRMTETASCLLKVSSHNWKTSQMGPSKDHWSDRLYLNCTKNPCDEIHAEIEHPWVAFVLLPAYPWTAAKWGFKSWVGPGACTALASWQGADRFRWMAP